MSKISRQINFFDLTGGINNVDTMERFNSSSRKTESPDMVNVEYYKLGGIKSMEGNIQIGDTQSAPIVGGWEYSKNNSRYMVIALQTGELKIFNPATNEFDEIYKFPHSSDRVSFCNMNNGVVATNGVDDPVFYEYGRHTALTGVVSVVEGSGVVTGTSTIFETELQPGDKIDIQGCEGSYTIVTVDSDTQITVTPNIDTSGQGDLSDKNIYLGDISQCNAVLKNTDPEVQSFQEITIRGNAIQFYAGRLWIGGENGLFYSQLGQYNKWDEYYDAGVIPEVYNDTSVVQALGLYSDFMLVHKRFNTYLLTMTDSSETMKIQPYSNITCNSQQSWIVSNTKYFVYSKEHMDIFPLSQRTIFSDRYLGDAITNKVRNIFQNLNDNETKNIFCCVLPRKRWMLFYMPMITGLGSNYVLIYDFQTKSFISRQLPSTQQVTIAFNYNNNVYVGTHNGKVLKEFAGSTFDGKNIEAYYKSPWFDWANNYTHSFSEFVIALASELNNNFKIRTFKDGGSEYESRVIDDSSLITSGLMWDGDVHNEENYTEWDKDVWTSGRFNSIRMLLPNNVFEQFQLEIYIDGEDNQAFAIDGYAFRRIETDEAPW